MADLPALLLAGVSAITVTAGARLLRGQDAPLMFALGVGVAGSTVILEKLLVERLNALRPRQSLVALFLCWAPLFLFSTALATFATFSWMAPEIIRFDREQSRHTHWSREVERVSTYILQLRSALRAQTEATQREIESDRARTLGAMQGASAYPLDKIRALQRRLAGLRDLDRRAASLHTPPLELPADDPEGHDQFERTNRELTDVHASAVLILPSPPPFPVYEPFTPPSGDLQSVLAEETRKRTWRALAAWTSALWVELLPVLALWRGGRKIPLAARVQHWRSSARETVDAFRGRQAAAALPIIIEPLQVRGVVRIVSPGEYTLHDCAPLLEEAVDNLSSVAGTYQLARVSSASGRELDEHLPLLPQLGGQPLVLSVVEGA